MENLTGGTPPVRYLPCVVPCKLYFTRFENTGNLWLALLRTAVGGALYFALSSIIKLLIGNLFPAGSMGYLLMRSVRYALVVFLLVGVYPLAFRMEKKLFERAKKEGI